MKLILKIKGLKTFASIGIFDWERGRRQKIELDVDFFFARASSFSWR